MKIVSQGDYRWTQVDLPVKNNEFKIKHARPLAILVVLKY
jgi:hypothetical protein